MAAEKEISSLRGVHYEDNMIPQNLVQSAPAVPLAPFDSPLHDALIRASMQVNSFIYILHAILKKNISREMMRRL